jgi:hypothetical protein
MTQCMCPGVSQGRMLLAVGCGQIAVCGIRNLKTDASRCWSRAVDCTEGLTCGTIFLWQNIYKAFRVLLGLRISYWHWTVYRAVCEAKCGRHILTTETVTVIDVTCV